MHAKELLKLNEQFKLREHHVIKKYKKLKKRFIKALAVIHNLERECDRHNSHIQIQENDYNAVNRRSQSREKKRP